MITKSLIKLIDEAVLPAVLLIVTKITSVFLAVYFAKIPFEIKFSSFLVFLPSIKFTNLSDYLLVENFSNVSIFSVCTLGTILVFVRLHYFHESHISPKLHAKLAKFNFESFITTSYHLYHQAAIWLAFTWLTVIFLIVSSFTKVTSIQIPIIAAILAANLTWIFARSIEREFR